MTQSSNTHIDQQALADKYVQERDRRLRSDGTAQYQELSHQGRMSHFLDDPTRPDVTPREPVVRALDVLVVGAGMSGLVTAAELTKLGITDFLQIDSAGGAGGTWYWNRYPGVRCDTESYIYMPLLEDTGTVPTEKYATGEEIREQFDRVAQKYRLDERALFQTRITSMHWDDERKRWFAETDRGDQLAARFVLLATGRTHRLKLPGIPGIERFQGHSFHTGRWDYRYTGGGPAGDLANLRDKRVAVIGTGATAVQCIPLLAQDAQELFIFQRTPTAVDARNNRPTDPEFSEGLEPGWQHERAVNFESVLMNLQPDDDLVNDQWSKVWGFPPLDGEIDPEELTRVLTEYDFSEMERIRRRVDAIVHDRGTAEALKPYYFRFCKRPTFNDDYLQAFNRSNVHLVDTAGKGPDEITPNGIVFDGELYEVDCIIYATGQEVGAAPPRAGEFTVVGREGVKLEQEWDIPEHVRSLHGIHVHGFPNLLLVGSMFHSSAGVNLTFPLTEQAKRIAGMVSDWLGLGITEIEVTKEAEVRYCELISTIARPDNPACTPGYYNSEGKGQSLFSLIFGENVMEYNEMLDRWLAGSWQDDMQLSIETPQSH